MMQPDNSKCCSGFCAPHGRCACAKGGDANQYNNCPEFPTQVG